jgi:hypothetical protein
MKPKEFPEQNVVFAKDQPQYQPLPAFRNESPQGEVITCWNLSFKERLRVLIKGEIWMSMMTFNKPLTPSFMTTEKKEVLTVETTLIRKNKAND